MHALRSINQDLVVKVDEFPDYQIHRFFYKNIFIRKMLWRPAHYFRVDTFQVNCNYCTEGTRCFVCQENWDLEALEAKNSELEAKITCYIHRLLQLGPEFECLERNGYLTLKLYGEPLFGVWVDRFTWDGSNAKSHFQEIKIFDDRLEIGLMTEEPIALYKADPFHSKILTELRKHEPFASAPKWF